MCDLKIELNLHCFIDKWSTCLKKLTLSKVTEFPVRIEIDKKKIMR